MRFFQSFEFNIEKDDPIISTPHELECISLHGYVPGGGFSWSVQFLPCDEHIGKLEELVAKLKEMQASR